LTQQAKPFEKDDLDQICRNLLENTLRQVFDHGYFHADVHPANVFILPGNVIGYVDFGIVGTISHTLRNSLTYYAMQLFRGEIERSTQELMRWITDSSQTDLAVAHNEIMAIAEEYYCSVALHDSDTQPQNSFASYQINVLNAIRRHHMAISPSIVASFRVLISVITMIYHLNPKFPLRDYANQYFSQLLISDAAAWLSPQEVIRRAFDLNLRFERVISAFESINSRERQTESSRRARGGLFKIYTALGGITMLVLALLGFSIPAIAGNGILVALIGCALLFPILALRELFGSRNN
jgi:predicted unusual protein kinase regulating ubiquinone biosynthesis (AarF/ABC1/UbiB family)